jgi:hypothetical protein
MNRFSLTLLGCFFSACFFVNGLSAKTLGTKQVESVSEKKKETSYLYVSAYGGYGVEQGMYGIDGQTGLGRFGIGVDAYQWKWVDIGFEAAVQSGNSARINIENSTDLANTGGLLPQTNLKAFPDLLFAMRLHYCNSFFLILKAGVAYQPMIFMDRTSSKDAVRKFNGEFQAGIGYNISEKVRLIGLYQGIYSGVELKITADQQVLLQNTPTQQNGLIGIDYSL